MGLETSGVEVKIVHLYPYSPLHLLPLRIRLLVLAQHSVGAISLLGQLLNLMSVSLVWKDGLVI